MENNQLSKINSFTRRSFSADEVYIFDVILCDNEIDRDTERFSHKALCKLQTLFVGKTGITDHNAKSENQLARIFDTQLVTDNQRLTSYGEPYEYLKASVYMIRTDANKDLISEIDGGIKKEVSISCSAGKRICSVCDKDKSAEGCNHVKGKNYNGKPCHIILDDITDAYEWSFVAVPAQINAGVTKHFSEESHYSSHHADITALKNAQEDIRRDIIRLAFFCGGEEFAKSAETLSLSMNTDELIGFKRKLEKNKSTEFLSQLSTDDNNSVDGFSV
ncbi:MAG: hypothetical protein J6A30_01065 [Ruminococcus sp.]|nr:hypothetical protein [Ruminococcus sp.]